MPGQLLKFLLVPDGSAARRVRRQLAERGSCSGVVVGSWPELVEWTRRSYLIPDSDDDWPAAFLGALSGLEDAFWARSLSVAPADTAQAVEAALIQVVSSADPMHGLEGRGLIDLPERPSHHLVDLLRLEKLLAGRLPDELSAIRSLLAADAGGALQTIRVHSVEGVPSLSRWQAALVEKLNRDVAAHGGDATPDEELTALLTRVLLGRGASDDRGALGVLQARLFSVTDAEAGLDESVQWVGVRDFLQEAEVAAGMVQSLLAAYPGLRPADIGLLVPDGFEYSVAVEDAFRLGGLAPSGLPAERWRRDLGREAVFHFLYCRQKPAPAMALAVCLSSPLMPWSREEGAALAQAVMDGDYRLRSSRLASAEARAMLDLLREGDSGPQTLIRALKAFVALLGGEEGLAGHVTQARAAAEATRATLEAATEIDWAGLRRAVAPRLITSGEVPDYNLEGVTIWRDSQEPWRAVRRLIVLGFAAGRYPAASGSSPVFSGEDIRAIRAHTGLAVSGPLDELRRRRSRFLRQLGAVAESVTFLIPRRDALGAVQAPSESLVFMHQLFAGPESAEGLVVELDAVDERERVRHLALAKPEPPRSPRLLVAEDLGFDRDLLALRTEAGGRSSRSPRAAWRRSWCHAWPGCCDGLTPSPCSGRRSH